MVSRNSVAQSNSGIGNVIPNTELAQMAMSYARSRMLWAAARLGVADAPADEVRSADDLAKTCQVDVDALYRLLRALASILCKEFPEAKIIILTAYASDVQGAMKLGARAYLLKTELDKEDLATIRMVYSGN